MKNYPKKEGERNYYVRMAVMVNETINAKLIVSANIAHNKNLGKYVAVEVSKDGYIVIPHAVVFKKESDCQKACDIHNKYHGFSKKYVHEVVMWSMGLDKKKKAIEKAAPFMLETLKKCNARIEGSDLDGGVMHKMIRSAINKTKVKNGNKSRT